MTVERTEADRRARVIRQNLRRQGLRDGTWRGLVPVGPVRERMIWFRDAGLHPKYVADQAGVSRSTVGRIAWPQSNGNRKQQTRVNAHVADALLNVTVDLDLVPDEAYVPGWGAQARLRSLLAVGHSARSLRMVVGSSDATFSVLLNADRPPRTYSWFRKDAVALWERLWDVDGGHGPSRRRAAERGWPTPMGLNEDGLDWPPRTSLFRGAMNRNLCVLRFRGRRRRAERPAARVRTQPLTEGVSPHGWRHRHHPRRQPRR